MTTPKKISVEFLLEKETKNTRKYAEFTKTGVAPVVGSLYLQKHAAEQLGNPNTLNVTLGG